MNEEKILKAIRISKVSIECLVYHFFLITTAVFCIFEGFIFFSIFFCGVSVLFMLLYFHTTSKLDKLTLGQKGILDKFRSSPNE